MARRGRIGGRRAVLGRDASDRLVLDWRGRRFDLSQCIVRHADHHGLVEFSITDPGGARVTARYPRIYPVPLLYSVQNPGILLELDEELWTWEDSDFGLFVFSVATRTGAAKRRHRLVDLTGDDDRDPSVSRWSIDGGVLRAAIGTGLRDHAVALADVTSLRVKFVLDSIWADPLVLVFETGDEVVALPVGTGTTGRAGAHDAAWLHAELVPALAALSGWGPRHAARLGRALRFQRTRLRASPLTVLGLNLPWYAERAVWRRGG